jgi:hypothetical protein
VNASKSLRIIGREIKRENAIGRASSSQILASCTTSRDHGSNPRKNLINQRKISSIFFSRRRKSNGDFGDLFCLNKRKKTVFVM